MDYSQLRNALTLHGGSLTIGPSTLTPNIASLLSDCNAGQPIVITNAASGAGDDQHETVVVKGQSNFLNVANLPIELRAAIGADGSAQLLLKYTLRGESPGADAWKFSTSFPTLPKVVDWRPSKDDPLTIPLDDLPLFNSYFIVVSDEQTEPDFKVELKPGINFVSQMRPADIVDFIENIFGHSKSFTVHGTIRLPKSTDQAPALNPTQFRWDLESAPGILLQADLGFDTAIGPMTLGDLAFRIYSPTNDDWLQRNHTYKPLMAFSGKLKIPSAKLELDVVAPMEPGSTELLLLGNFEGVSIGKLEDPLNLAGTADLHSQLPDQLQQAASPLGKLELTHAGVSLSLVKSQPGVTWASFTIGMPERKWKVWDDHFEIDGLACRFEVTDPFNSAPASGEGGPLPGKSKFEVNVSGTLQIEGVPVNILAGNREGFTVYAELANTQTISLKQLMHTYVLGVPAPGDLTINTLRLSVAPHKSYSMALAVSDWNFFGSPDLTISQAYLYVDHAQDQAAATQVAMRGSFLIAGIGIDVYANYRNGWSFDGQTRSDQEIAVGDLLHDLARKFSITLPDALADSSLQNVAVNFSTSTEEPQLDFSCTCLFPIAGTKVEIIVFINVKKTATAANQPAPTSGLASYDVTLKGKLSIGSEEFDVDFDSPPGAKKIFVSWAQTKGALQFEEVARTFGLKSMPPLPENLDLALKNVKLKYDLTAGTLALAAHSVNYGQVLFASLLTPHDSPEPGKRVYLLSLDVPLNLELSGLPLVGGKLPSEAQLGIKNLQIIVASSDLATSDVTALNALIKDTLKDAPLIPASLAEGLTFASELQMGGGSQPVVVQLIGSATTGSSSKQPASTSARTSAAIAPQAGSPTVGTGQTSAPDYHADAKWFNLQKSIGPVYFDKIGVQYQDAVLWFLLDASLSAAGLTISLDGLSVGSPLTKFSPHFNLHGLGIDFQGGPVEIGAAFLKIEGQPDQYNGAAVIKTPEAALSALGSYAELDGHPSLFIYAFLNYPLGGPVFFFVTGLAAGFGYNRKLIPPSIDKVADFPLVRQALGAVTAPTKAPDALQALTDYVPPAIGEIFLAVGVKFNSFKLIDSFALITVQFGGPVVASVMGVSTAIVPTPDPQAANSVTPLAEAQIAWKATFDPADGFLGVDARLTPNSYILSRDCHLTGGYAFYSWLSGKHAGDFVQTLGGYHPRFAAPAHYPVVPRLGFLWHVSSELTIKGDAYYALTGSALMAGGSLEVLFDEGDLKAWLKMGADFLISWKPYHYDIGLYVDVGASYTFDINLLFGHIRKTISVDVGADLHLWGPDFSGTAEVDISVISFTISFGAGASQTPNPIDWAAFQASFLPAHDKVCSLSVKDGLVRTMKEGDDERDERWIINPKHFSLLVNTAIPLKSAQSEQKELITADANTRFGIGSMAVQPAELQSTLTIAIKHDGALADEEFSFAPILKKVPAGLWGESLTPDLNGNTFIENVPAGVELTPRKSHEPGETARIDLSLFKYAPSYFPKDAGYPVTAGFAYAWEPGGSFVLSSNVDGRESVSKTIENNSQRKLLLEALNVAVAVNISGKVAADFLSAPRVGTFSG